MNDLKLNILCSQVATVANKQSNNQNTKATSVAKEQVFSEVLKNQIQQVKFSNHATQRMNYRNIKLDAAQNLRLEEAVSKAADKGLKDSLILLDNNAFIVNIPNKTVVTVVDQTNLKDNVFTNIDGAVII
ncbi:TIGR02530 family flagellar biosynthesis protein [Succinispira mobilis]|uniref:TIGR02530 family flagellar biosynthesis protein n=1 Tax=Succinispira mobilis TaxID=78120 RepID=UPI00035F7270|nr:TIGR02530 family flagellar biosynthesis protein [Succinispira mobilis]